MDIHCSGTVAWYALERGRPFSIDMRTQLAKIIGLELARGVTSDTEVDYQIRSVQNVAFDLQTSSNEDDDEAVNANNIDWVLKGFDVLAIEGSSFPLYAQSALRGRKWVYIALFDRAGKFLRWQKYAPSTIGGCHHDGNNTGCHCKHAS